MTSGSYAKNLASLRVSYDNGAAERERYEKTAWKLAEREAALARFRDAGCRRLLELGAGTGQDSLFFQNQGMSVVATDASATMVVHCRAKGLDARELDFLSLDENLGEFDAAYAMNSLLHVTNAELPTVLRAIRAVLVPGALFYVGTYRGEDTEGFLPKDSHDPPRFFSLRRDETLQRLLGEQFELLDFHAVELEDHPFQSVLLRRPR
jgi:SAM-dependent methyltransferase